MNKEAPFWWPAPQALIAIMLVVAMIALVFVLALRKEPTQDSDLLKIVVGGLMTVGFASIINFYFGSSKESATKGDTLSKIATGQTESNNGITINSSSASGPATTVGDVTKPLALIAMMVLGSMLLFAQPSRAQDIFNLNKKSAANDKLTKLMNDIASIKAEIISGTIADIQAADADAATLTNPSSPTSFRDPIAHECYPAEVKFLQSLPTAAAPTGTFVLVQLFQKKRDFVAQLQAGIPTYLKIGCSALLGDEVTILTKSLSLVGVTVAANALLPGSGLLTMPAL